MFTARPPAKLNLTLEVAPRGEDGFHRLRSVFLRIGLSDWLTVRQAVAEHDRLTVGSAKSVPLEGNIVLRALSLVRQRAGLDLLALDVQLDKQIPVAAGLAGGSSDGAAMLDLAAACWGVGLSPQLRLELAAELGSDVPFFATQAAAALVEGRGELVTPLPGVEGRPGVLLVSPPIEISTAAAFARFDDLGQAPARDSVTSELADAFRAGLDARGLLEWSDRLRMANDLWASAISLAPELAGLREALEAGSGRPWLMTGSGSALFALYASPQEAVAAGHALSDDKALGEALVVATDLEGPDPAWRYP